MIASANASAIRRGFDYLIAGLADEKTFFAYWSQFLLELSNIARTAVDPELQVRAEAEVARQVSRLRAGGLTLPSKATLWDCQAHAIGLLACRGADLLPLVRPSRLRAATRRLADDEEPPIRAGEGGSARSLKLACQRLFAAWVGLGVGLPLAGGYGAMLRQVLALRPYGEPPYESGSDASRRLGFLVTHVVYTVSDYNELRIDPSLLAPERVFMLRTLEALVERDDCELVGEYLDALRSAGLPEDDTRLVEAARWLVGRQREDGGWGSSGSDPYARAHVAIAAIQGLRGYRRLGEGPVHDWIVELLRTEQRGSRRAAACAPAGSVQREGLSRTPWPPADGLIARHAVSRRPVIVEGAATACPALERWTDRYLGEAAAGAEVVVEVSHDEIFAHPERPLVRKTVALRSFLDSPEGDEGRYYLAQCELAGDLAVLARDVPLERVLPPDVECSKKLWFSVGDAVTPLHQDGMDNLLAVFRGRKRLTLFPPWQGPLLYPARDTGWTHFSRVDAEAPDLERFPLFARAESLVVALEAGDALFIPTGWWHHVRSFDTSLAVTLLWRFAAPVVA